jgi:mannitol-1-phosphate 5-dehydrogenase
MKAVQFGAGNIGRGFIGLLLSRAGYEVCFVDINDVLVSQINQKHTYTVTLADHTRQTTVVSGVSAINGEHMEQVAEAVAVADLVTTAVGVATLEHIALGIARGIEKRFARSVAPLHIIACENAIGASSRLREYVFSQLAPDIRRLADSQVKFPNVAIDRIVPIQHCDSPLEVVVEPFYEWIVDRSSWLPDTEPISGIRYEDRLEPYMERKLFTVNTGHCFVAYLGYLYGYSTIDEAMSDVTIAEQVKGVLEETGALLVSKYPFDRQEHASYIHHILERFRNPYLTDEVVRVARSPIRKISPNDRLAGPALQAYERGIEPRYLCLGIAAAFLFDYREDAEAAELQVVIRTDGIHQAIAKYTGLAQNHPLHSWIVHSYNRLSMKRAKGTG